MMAVLRQFMLFWIVVIREGEYSICVCVVNDMMCCAVYILL